MVKGVLLDMDGVLYHGTQPLEGAVEFLDWLALPYAYVTNNSSRTPQQVADKLGKMGIVADPATILTSSIATAAFLRNHFPQNAPLYCIGEVGLRTAIQEAGFVLSTHHPLGVVVGLDRELTASKEQVAVDAVKAGASFIATNMDPVLMTESGSRPGTGSIVQGIINKTGIIPQIMGKPERPIFDMAAQLLNLSLPDLLMIGDNVETDIRGAAQHGMQSAFVLTGVSTIADYEQSGLSANLIINRLPDLINHPIFKDAS